MSWLNVITLFVNAQFSTSRKHLKLNSVDEYEILLRSSRRIPISFKDKNRYMKSREWKVMQKIWLHKSGYRCQMFPFILLGQHSGRGGWSNSYYGKYAIHHMNKSSYENLGLEELNKDVIVLSKFAHSFVYHFLLSFGKRRAGDQKILPFANPFQKLMNHWCTQSNLTKIVFMITNIGVVGP